MSSSSKKTVNDLDDEDSENDSDYCPENDPEADHDVEDDEGTTGLSTISFGRKRKAADEWAAMQENSAPVANNTTAGSTSKASKKKKSSGKKNTDILAAIFGKKASAKIMNSAPSSQTSKMDANRIKEAARESYQTLQKKTVVKETRKFAGQEITIERTVTGAESSNSQKLEKSKASALDNVLDTIKGPKTVNMVAKSGYDWDAYKEREGLEENLAVASKEGFLTRKDFLQRCDYRAYEQERDDRLTHSK